MIVDFITICLKTDNYHKTLNSGFPAGFHFTSNLLTNFNLHNRYSVCIAYIKRIYSVSKVWMERRYGYRSSIVS